MIVCADSTNLSFLESNSVSLIVTSPPYFNAGKDYDEHSSSFSEYLSMLRSVISQSYSILRPGGRFCLNIAGLHRSPYISLSSFVHRIFDELNYTCLGENIWFKGHALGTTTAWGSWRKPSCPTLRDVHEYILIYQKPSQQITKSGAFKLPKLPYTDDYPEVYPSKDEFVQFTRSVWEFSPKSSKLHPAVFPEELPYRCILLYTYPGDIVLDPFMGIGTTCVVAKRLHRRYIGIDNSQEYVDIAKGAVADAVEQEILGHSQNSK